MQPQESKSASSRRIIFWICALLLGVLLIFSIDAFIGFFLGSQFSGNIEKVYGTHPFLTSIIFYLVAFGVQIAWHLLKGRGINILVMFFFGVVPIIYFTVLYVGAKDQFFTREGEPTQCYVVTREGVSYDTYYIGGNNIDPNTGEECLPVDRDIRPMLKILDVKMRSGTPITPIDPHGAAFFSIANGKPIVWYTRMEDGRFDFFDTPGFHPITGEKLKPVTKQVVVTWREHELLLKRQVEEVASKKLEAESAVAQEALKRDRINLFRDSLGAHSIRSGAVIVAVSPIGTVIDGDSRAVVSVILLAFRERGILVEEIRQTAYTNGVFKTLFQGYEAPLVEAGLSGTMGGMLLIQPTVECHETKSIAEMTSCQVSIDYRVLRSNGTTIHHEHVEAAAPGATKDLAIKQATRKLLANSTEIFSFR